MPKKERFYLKVKTGGEVKEAIIEAYSMSNVLSSFRQHNIPILDHFHVDDSIQTIEDVQNSYKYVSVAK